MHPLCHAELWSVRVWRLRTQYWSFGPVPALHDVMIDLQEEIATLVHPDVPVLHDRHA